MAGGVLGVISFTSEDVIDIVSSDTVFFDEFGSNQPDPSGNLSSLCFGLIPAMVKVDFQGVSAFGFVVGSSVEESFPVFWAPATVQTAFVG